MIRGRVVNAVTKEPVARVLVDAELIGGAASGLTDDRGQFELKITLKNSGSGSRFEAAGGQGIWGKITASKPGFFSAPIGYHPESQDTLVAVEDTWGFEWMKAGVLERYVKNGKSVVVESGGEGRGAGGGIGGGQ